MFAWQIYLFMTNSCDLKWKTIMVFSGTRFGFGGYKSFGVKERHRNLSESDDASFLTTSPPVLAGQVKVKEKK